MNQSNKYNDRKKEADKKIKELRLKNNLSLSNLSIKLALMGIDISKPSLHKLENGNRVIKDYELYGLSEVFNVPVSELLSDFASEIKKNNAS